MRRYAGTLVRSDTGAVVSARVEIADTFLTRLAGLQFRRQINVDEGFLIVPCSSIHTAWMRFSIDALFLDESGRVLAKSTDLKPWRVFARRGAYAVLELASGAAAGIDPGTSLTFREVPERRSVQFLRPADHAE